MDKHITCHKLHKRQIYLWEQWKQSFMNVAILNTYGRILSILYWHTTEFAAIRTHHTALPGCQMLLVEVWGPISGYRLRCPKAGPPFRSNTFLQPVQAISIDFLLANRAESESFPVFYHWSCNPNPPLNQHKFWHVWTYSLHTVCWGTWRGSQNPNYFQVLCFAFNITYVWLTIAPGEWIILT